jgi:hypothetical protein
MLGRVFKEPLLHFLLLALLIFAGYGLLNADADEKPDTIVVTAPKIEQMAMLFAKTWQRPPTASELRGLIDDYVKEEILVRQALELRLDRDDTVVRRRLRQKMEFLGAADLEAPAPTDAELQAYLTANSAAFEIDPMLSFRQIFLNPKLHGNVVEQDAAAILEVLLSQPAADPAQLGDATLLPPELPPTSKRIVGEIFGADFAEAIDKAIPGQWTGPIRSSFGLHLVRVMERVPGRVPALAEVREAVARDWANARRKELEERRFAELLKRYVVTINSPADTGTGS